MPRGKSETRGVPPEVRDMYVLGFGDKDMRTCVSRGDYAISAELVYSGEPVRPGDSKGSRVCDRCEKV